MGVARGRSGGTSSMEAMPLNLSQMMGQKKVPVSFLSYCLIFVILITCEKCSSLTNSTSKSV